MTLVSDTCQGMMDKVEGQVIPTNTPTLNSPITHSLTLTAELNWTVYVKTTSEHCVTPTTGLQQIQYVQ